MGVEIAAEVQVTQLQHRGHSSNLVTMVTTPAATKYFDHPYIVCITDSILERAREREREGGRENEQKGK